MKYQDRNKIIIISAIVIVVFMIFCLATCGGGCRRSSPVNSGRKTEKLYSSNDHKGRRRSHNGRKGKQGNHSEKSKTPYEPQIISVPPGSSIGDALLDNNPYFRDEDPTKGLGGSKLIAEMSADVYGIYSSRNSSSEGVKIRICSIEELNLHLSSSSKSVYSRILDGQIIMGRSSVGFHGDELSTIRDFLSAILTGEMQVFFSFTNLTNQRIECEIQQGQMLEIVNEDVQNLVVAETVSFTIGVHETLEVQAHVYCASRNRGDPSRSSVRFTQYILNASSSVYETQQSVWNYIESSYR